MASILTDGAAVSVPATSTVNAFAGHPVEFLGLPSMVRLLLTADAAGVSAQMLVNQGANQIAPMAAGASINVASVAGAGPKDDEDTVIPQVAIPAGSRNQLNLTNTTASAVVVRWRAQIVS